MLIRSQDFKRLINMDNVEKIGIYKSKGNFNIETVNALLGTYSSENRAIEVMDMIEIEYAAYKNIFQMPDNKEEK